MRATNLKDAIRVRRTPSLKALPAPGNAHIAREKWLKIIEPRWARVLLALDVVEQACENRSRYPGASSDDLEFMVTDLCDKFGRIEEAFRRGKRAPAVRFPRTLQ